MRVSVRTQEFEFDENGMVPCHPTVVCDDPKAAPNRPISELCPPAPAPPPAVASTPISPDAERRARIALEAAQGKERIAHASAIRDETSKAIKHIFNEMAEDKLDVNLVHAAVGPLISDMVQDQTALLSLVHLKDVDEYTFAHSVDVAVLSIALALRAGYASDIEEIGVGALMHDIGKSKTPLHVLNKPAPLTDAEMTTMKQHPLDGARMLIQAGGFGKVAIAAVLDHHENLAGKGYPRGKRGAEIYEHALIVSIADVYDALTTHRPYRTALTPKQAVLMMTQKFKDALHPDLLREFVSLIGFYPVGTEIHLRNGCVATVISSDPHNPVRPGVIELTTDALGKPFPAPIVVDVREMPHLLPQDSPADVDVSKIDPRVLREYQEFKAFA